VTPRLGGAVRGRAVPRSAVLGSAGLGSAVLAGALLLGACSSSTDSVDSVEDLSHQVEDLAEAAPTTFERYVALGDSFTAGPLIPTTDLARGCLRSDSNYPAIVAERLDIPELVDVSCGGATTRDLTGRQATTRGASVPPQLKAVTSETDLVTLGIGGNDFGLFHTLVTTCTGMGGERSTGSPCADRLRHGGVDLVARADQIGDRVAAGVGRIRERAPGATVAVVGYLRLAPERGRCRDLPLARGDYEYGARVMGALNDALERAARRTDAIFVDMHAASEGHDVCSEEPWVNGRRTVQGEALSYHPFAEGMEAVADELVEALSP
jgi:lysophospholipase L1-like esterase